MVSETSEKSVERSQAGSPESFGEWMRQARSRQNLSQRDLADQASISRSYLSDIERGRGARPSIAVLDRLALALGASRSDLLRAAGVIEQAAGDAGERRIIALYRDLSTDGKSAIERFARFLRDEEHRFVQPSLIGDDLNATEDHFRQTGPTLFDLPPIGPR